jgi:peptidyl-tRNA hydrolase, PTH1 family
LADAVEPSVSRPLVIAGLGNPGLRYEWTPHNMGFLVIDELARRHNIRATKSESQAILGSGQIQGKPIILMKPQTFMNLSGSAIGTALSYRNLTNHDLLVVYDELDLPWSALRIKKNGSAAGHNGVKSIIGVLKTDVFMRVRVGIHPGGPMDAATYVLSPFAKAWNSEVVDLVSYTADAIESIIAEGADKAMAKFNRRAPGSKEEEE